MVINVPLFSNISKDQLMGPYRPSKDLECFKALEYPDKILTFVAQIIC